MTDSISRHPIGNGGHDHAKSRFAPADVDHLRNPERKYAGFKIHLKQPENADGAIDGVVAIIRDLPAGTYTLGLPRPKGGKEIDPEHDVFLPVTDHDQVTMSPGKGNLKKDIAALKEASREKIREAIAGNSEARIKFMYPDGVDHLHIKDIG